MFTHVVKVFCVLVALVFTIGVARVTHRKRHRGAALNASATTTASLESAQDTSKNLEVMRSVYGADTRIRDLATSTLGMVEPLRDSHARREHAGIWRRKPRYGSVIGRMSSCPMMDIEGPTAAVGAVQVALVPNQMDETRIAPPRGRDMRSGASLIWLPWLVALRRVSLRCASKRSLP